jgi:hypothetical protein
MNIITNQKKVVDGATSNRADRRAPAKSLSGKFLAKVETLDLGAQAKNPTLAAAVPGAGCLVIKRGGLNAVLPTVDGGARVYCLNALNEIVFFEKRVVGQTPIQIAAE